ncbi:MAG: molybdopterin molybdotransferase MoeA [bacterium]|nr:molybdopterin molybdotransferase MoeA [bacterium]
MISLEKAIKIIWNTAKILPVEEVDLLLSHGRVLAEDIKAPFDYPPFDRAAMDGYALKVKDTYSASKNQPVLLQISGEIQAGTRDRFYLSTGKCLSVMTGSYLPEGTDAVVKIEDVETIKNGKKYFIKVFKPIGKGENISFKGEDLRKGQIIIKKGNLVDAAVFMMLAYLGKSKVKVRKQPHVSILATGDELIEPGTELEPHKIYNANSYGLYGLVMENGGIPHNFGIAKDNEKSLTETLKESLRYDIAIISGGVSEGKFDLVIRVLRKLGVKDIFWKVAVKPGKPVYFGKKGDTLVFGLPGYPVSAYLSFHMMVKTAFQKMFGYRRPISFFIYGVLSSDIRNDGDRTALLRVKIIPDTDDNIVVPYHKQKSGMLSSVVETTGLVIVKKGEHLKKGERVKCFVLRDFYF